MEKKLSAKNYVGYTLVDFANNLAFCVMSSYLTLYCTDILGMSGAVISAILIIARIWDAVNDPMMGFLAQRRKPGKNGKYKPFILWGGIPLSLTAVLVFTKVSDSVAFNTAWVAVFYIAYGMLYTVLLVPYGSLASVMTNRENERSILSICRSIGAGIGNLPTFIFPIVVMSAGTGGNQMDETRLFWAMVVIAVAMCMIYAVSYKCIDERVLVDTTRQKTKVLTVLKHIFKDRAFIVMSLLGCLLMAVQMYTNTVNRYLVQDYFQNSSMNTVYMVVSYAPMVIMMPFVNVLIKKFGKKEICVAGLAVSTVASFLTYILKVGMDNVWLFIILAVFVNIGIGFLTLEGWAMAADIIDHQEWVTGRREEASNYAIFTFMRKVGQARAALAPWFVSLAGYDSSKAGTGVSQGETVLSGMYDIATLVPVVLFAIMLILAILYPLNKKTTEKMHAELAVLHESQHVETV